MASNQFQQDRMELIKNLTIFIENITAKVERLTEDLGWTKEQILEDSKKRLTGDNQRLLHCPYDANHQVRPDNIEEHIKLCRLKSAGFKDILKKELPESSSWFYNSLSSVTQVFLGKAQFHSLGIAFDKTDSEETQLPKKQGQELFTPIDPAIISRESKSSEEVSTSIEDACSTVSDAPKTPTGELKYIYSWSHVPNAYKHIDISILDPMSIRAWLIENVPDNQLSNVVGADVKLVNFVMDCLKVPRCHPDSLVSQLAELFLKETQSFVLKLWKYLSTAVICKKHNISEVVRKESEVLSLRIKNERTRSEGMIFGGLQCMPVIREPLVEEFWYSSDRAIAGRDIPQLPLPVLESPSFDPEACLPANVMMTYLTPEQRLKLYEYVVETAKSKGIEGAFTVEDLEKESEAQMNALMMLEQDEDRPRSHMEAMAELRDYKRRRQTYRARNQNSNRRSAIDVLRELIDQQTKYLEIIGGKKISDDVPSDLCDESAEKPSRVQENAEEREYSRDRTERRRSSGSRDDRGQRAEERPRFGDRRSSRDYRYERDGRERSDRRSKDRDGTRSRDRSRERLVEDGRRYADRDRNRDRRYRDSRRERGTLKGSKDEERYLERTREGHRDSARDALDKHGKRMPDDAAVAKEKSPYRTARISNSNSEKSQVKIDVSKDLTKIRYGLDVKKSDNVTASETTMSDARILAATMSDATVVGAPVSETTVRDAVMSDSTVSGANVLGANVSDATMTNKYREFISSLGPEFHNASTTNTNCNDHISENAGRSIQRDNLAVSDVTTKNSQISANADLREEESLNGSETRGQHSRSRSSSVDESKHKHKKEKHKHKHKKNKHKHKSKKRKHKEEVQV